MGAHPSLHSRARSPGKGLPWQQSGTAFGKSPAMVVKDGWRDDDDGRLGSGTVAQTLTKARTRNRLPVAMHEKTPGRVQGLSARKEWIE
ncbi:uncharacterized protein CCOS01_02682 [Colletotrichum costaricense]|uniref:Uncharacterized protein n=1 Tax=Colletotrichum costaricense TaxID=1209916 RepID=A0AAI9Z9W6_9PEZI|nr:uncharacterized protein CCOS01_02682 [Colletotrichum costaricense]KAK1537362.1 hypothetical protein CCOS01_02682 [Colletotrichum costaricense]